MQNEIGVLVRVGSPDRPERRRQPSRLEKVAYPDAETVLPESERCSVHGVQGPWWLQRAVFVQRRGRAEGRFRSGSRRGVLLPLVQLRAA